jgi:WhiB family redox-sensing transcriptional regulator
VTELAAILASEAPAPTTPARVERVFLEREVAQGERLSARALARELGVDRADPTRILRRLRALRVQDPGLAVLRTRFAAIQRMTPAELAQAAEQARIKHIDVIEAGAWWQAAACAGMDPERFFPPEGGGADAARAQRVCAACPVRAECLRAELAAPVGFQPQGIFGGTAPWERTALRVAEGAGAGVGRFLADRDLTEQAHQRAGEVGITRAARELDTSRDTLGRAFARWGLPAVPAQPSCPRRFATRAQAAEAYTLAVRVGITPAAKRLGSDYGTLREAFARFHLPWPPPRQRRPVRLVDPVFFALNPAVLVPARLWRQAGARVRRQEEFEVLGARVVYALGDENHRPPYWRAWNVAQRAREAQQAARTARLAVPTTRPGRPAGPPATPTRTSTGTEDPTGTQRGTGRPDQDQAQDRARRTAA